MQWIKSAPWFQKQKGLLRCSRLEITSALSLQALNLTLMVQIHMSLRQIEVNRTAGPYQISCLQVQPATRLTPQRAMEAWAHRVRQDDRLSQLSPSGKGPASMAGRLQTAMLS